MSASSPLHSTLEWCQHPTHSTLDGSDEEMSAPSPLYSTWLRRRNSDEEMSASSPLYSTWLRRRNVSIQSTLLYMVKKKKCQHPVHSTLHGSAPSPLYSRRRRNVGIQSTPLYTFKKKKCQHPTHSTLDGSDEEMSASSPLYSTWLREEEMSASSALYSTWLRRRNVSIQSTLLYMVQKKKCRHPVHSTLHV